MNTRNVPSRKTLTESCKSSGSYTSGLLTQVCSVSAQQLPLGKLSTEWMLPIRKYQSLAHMSIVSSNTILFQTLLNIFFCQRSQEADMFVLLLTEEIHHCPCKKHSRSFGVIYTRFLWAKMHTVQVGMWFFSNQCFLETRTLVKQQWLSTFEQQTRTVVTMPVPNGMELKCTNTFFCIYSCVRE